MNKKIIEVDNFKIAVISDKEPIITSSQAMLDLIATVDYYDSASFIVIYKSAIIEDFFDLSTNIAGDILQKVVNYKKKIAIVGDFSAYESKALKDFIYECNNGNSIFWASTEDEAIKMIIKSK